MSFDESKPRITIAKDRSISTLLINNVTNSDSGNYTCKASKDGLSDSYTSQLLVNSKPNWVTEPKDVDFEDGRTLKLDCLASGSPAITVNWIFNSKKGKF